MLTRLTIFLTDDERFALQIMAREDLRGLRDQIRFLLREAIFSRSLLNGNVQSDQDVAASTTHQAIIMPQDFNSS